MQTMTKHIRGGILTALIISGALVGGAMVFAEEHADDDRADVSGITFPVAPLGNCASKAACHAYCEESEHMDACIAFAKEHGLMNKEEAERSEKFSRRLKDGKTPGGCDSPGNCKTYCEDITHLDECVAFAEAQDFKGEEYARGKKLGAYLKKGGTMPGGCTSRASCEAYCSDFSRAEECYRFAEAAGVGDDMGDAPSKHGGPAQKVSLEHLKRLGELAKKGETPGGCTNKDACMAYCEQAGNMEECIAFGEKVGFMGKEEVERARAFLKSGGPGGCTSQESCHAYCNDPANRETCFTFAEENGLIPKEELEQMKEGMVRMRQGLENAPPEVSACLRSTMGDNIIADIQSGKLVPGPEIGERMRSCFEKFGAHQRPQQIFFEAPPEVKACLEEKLGDTYAGVTSGKVEPTPEMADTFRVCFQQVEFERSNGWGVPGDAQQGEGGNMGGQRPNPQMLEQFLRSAPPEIRSCLKGKLGERFAAIENGTLMPGPEVGETMRACFESFGGIHQGMEGGTPQGMMVPPNEGMRARLIAPTTLPVGASPSGVSPEVQMMRFIGQFPLGSESCLKEKLGEEGFMKVAAEGRTPELEAAIRECLSRLQVGGGSFQPPPTPPLLEQGTMPATAAWTNNLPLPIQECLKNKFGERYAQLGYQPPTADVEIAIRACYSEVSGGNIQVVPFNPTPDGLQVPPPETTAPQSRMDILSQQLLGAALAPFVALRDIFR